MNIFLSGYYGFGNAGDEFILKYVSEFLKSRYNAIIYALSGDINYSNKRIKNLKFIERNDFEKISCVISFSDLAILSGFDNVDYMSEVRKNAMKYLRTWDDVLKKFCYLIKHKVL